MIDKYPPKTRAEGRKTAVVIDANTGEEYVTAFSSTGRRVDKNRSDTWRGYKSHLTKRQRRVIAWALRQRDKGISRQKIFDYIVENDLWRPSVLQYPLSKNTIASWELTRKAMEKRGKEWPL